MASVTYTLSLALSILALPSTSNFPYWFMSTTSSSSTPIPIPKVSSGVKFKSPFIFRVPFAIPVSPVHFLVFDDSSSVPVPTLKKPPLTSSRLKAPTLPVIIA